jgi:ABC-2 family transporter protein
MISVARMALLDLRTLVSYRRQLLAVFAVVAVLTLGGPVRILPLIAIYSILVSGYPFAMADQYDLDTLFAVLPLRRRVVLLGHYAAAVTTYLLFTAAGTACAIAIGLVRSDATGATGFGELLALSWAAFAVLVALQYPVLVRLGYTRARFVASLPVFVLFGGVALVGPHVHGIARPGALTVILAIVGGAAALALSFFVSVLIDPHRDVRGRRGGARSLACPEPQASPAGGGSPGSPRRSLDSLSVGDANDP